LLQFAIRRAGDNVAVSPVVHLSLPPTGQYLTRSASGYFVDPPREESAHARCRDRHFATADLSRELSRELSRWEFELNDNLCRGIPPAVFRSRSARLRGADEEIEESSWSIKRKREGGRRQERNRIARKCSARIIASLIRGNEIAFVKLTSRTQSCRALFSHRMPASR